VGAGHLIVVDGYNLIHRTPELRPGPGQRLEESRARLVNLLSWAIGSGEARFLVVFDGDRAGGGESGGGRVTVRFSRPPQKADDLIRAIVEAEVGKVERLTVVTADLEVARHARAMGADIALSDLFLASVLGPGRKGKPEDEKPATLSKKDLEQWAALFRARGGPDAPPDEADET
jgi:predicted RNA-binding protein with PIN domain